MNLLAVKQRFGIIGNDEQLNHALSTAVRVAPTDLTVLITGESGVGKESISKIIHSHSARKHSTFIAINCGAIPEGTINSELFGHEKGAFTGATSDRKGYFETANGGTIFLDEIGEMPLDTQSFLLRILESGEFIKVGSSKVLKTDVRIVAATNVVLEEKVRSGKFREDLYYRLNTIPIKVPALRERPSDIYILFRKFAVDFAEKYRSSPIQLEEDARVLLKNYTWPGNIRELKNLVEQMSILSDERLISAQDLLDYLPNLNKRNLPILSTSAGDGMDMNEREILYKLLFDMKHDLNHLKSLVFELIQSNNLQVPDTKAVAQLNAPMIIPQDQQRESNFSNLVSDFNSDRQSESSSPMIINDALSHAQSSGFNNMEVVEESLKLEDAEKELIKKALKKHKGKRKEAANDLGISERTLYRKIKEYDI